MSPTHATASAVHIEVGHALLDLLTREEEAVDLRTMEYRFGASTGAAAALIAAAERPALVRAVVSRGGRPDLAGDALPKVKAPTLLIVGGHDEEVIELNCIAMRQMRAPVELKIVPGATHLFEEPGTLDVVSRLALDWCRRHVARVNP